jgi:hypothetical protein
MIAFRRQHPALHSANFYSSQQLPRLRPDAAADAAFNNPEQHDIAWLIDGIALGDAACAIYVAYDAWSAP